MTTLLPPNALHGWRVGISVSESTDLERLGLLESHFRLAVGEISRAVFLAGGTLAYGGHLEPEGYTPFLAHELKRFDSERSGSECSGSKRSGGVGSRLLICLAWQVHRELKLSDLLAREIGLGVAASVVCLDPDGNVVDPRDGRAEERVPVPEPELRARALTAMRHYMLDRTSGRVLLGGRRAGFTGQYPGLVEEALMSLAAKQPLYLAGGFGGVTADVAETLGVGGGWLPPDTGAPSPDPGLSAGLERVAEMRTDPGPWTALHNGLDAAENARLAATHRPADIAALVVLGLSRIAQAANPGPVDTPIDAPGK